MPRSPALHDHAWEDYLYWQDTDRTKAKRINALLRDVLRHPFEGVSNAERLRGHSAGFPSRRIYAVIGDGITTNTQRITQTDEGDAATGQQNDTFCTRRHHFTQDLPTMTSQDTEPAKNVENVYAPPDPPTLPFAEVRNAAPAVRVGVWGGPALALLSFTSCALTDQGALPQSESTAYATVALFGLAVVAIPVLLVATLTQTSRAWLWSLLGTSLGVVATLFWGLAHLHFSSRGRAHRRKGRAQLPAATIATTASTWPTTFATLPHSDAAAAGWRGNAATELASVAAFGHVALELVALGAPPELIEAAHRDALDEVQHARICYGIAQAYGGGAMGPAPFPAAVLPPERPTTLHAVCTEAVKESAWLELASAMVAAALAEHEGVPAPVAAALRTIAEDEARHAAHGREVVAWCVAQEGIALAADMLALCTEFDAEKHVPRVPGGLREFGLADSNLWRACVVQAKAAVSAWLTELTADQARAA